MPDCQSLPEMWLLSDQRNDALLDRLLRSFDEPIGFVFRHYHLAPDVRRARFDALARIASAQGHVTILAGSERMARQWGAQGAYGSPHTLTPKRQGLLTIATAHNMREIGAANRLGADAVMLSPVFPTRSHPGADSLGILRFLGLALHAQMPVIALGGMDARKAARMRWPHFAAIDGFSIGQSQGIS